MKKFLFIGAIILIVVAGCQKVQLQPEPQDTHTHTQMLTNLTF